MDKINQSFTSDGLNIAEFIRFLFNNKNIIIIFLLVTLSSTYFFLQLRPTTYESSVSITPSDDFSNISFINKYNYYVRKISENTEASNLTTTSNQKLFDQWLKIFRDRSVFENIIKSLNVINPSNYDSELDYELALLNEINKIKLESKKFTSLEKIMWEKDMISLPYILSYESNDQKISKQILINIIDEINLKGKKELIKYIDSMSKYIDFYTATKANEIKTEIEQIKIISRNDILNKIEYLKNQSNIAEKLNILYPEEFENDNYPFVVSNREEAAENRYYDGKIALDLEISELEKAIVDDFSLNAYTEKLNIEKYLELNKLLDNNLKKEVSKFRIETKEANISLIYYNSSQINIKAKSSNMSIIMLIAAIFSFILSLLFLYVRTILQAEKIY